VVAPKILEDVKYKVAAPPRVEKDADGNDLPPTPPEVRVQG
jgi:hypothetical protein